MALRNMKYENSPGERFWRESLNYWEFVDPEVSQESENKIVDPHAGKIKNPITGEWSWF